MTTKEIRETVRQFIIDGNDDETVLYSDLVPKFEHSKNGPIENLVLIQDVSGKQQNYCDGARDNLIDLIIHKAAQQEVMELREILEEDFDGSCYDGVRFTKEILEETYLGVFRDTNMHVCRLRIRVLD